ncbi:MAG: hypothetical protein ACE37K_22780 [Planctomycetota bacterium]
MRRFLSLCLLGILVGCAAEPPLRQSVAAPIALGSIVDDRLGVWPLDRKPTRTWQALRGTSQEIARRDRSLIVGFDDEVIREVRYFFGRSFSESGYEDLEPTHTIVVFAQPKGSEDVVRPLLSEAGLEPTRILGLDPGEWLTTATVDPDWVLRWIDGRVHSAVRGPAGKAMVDVLRYRDVDDLAAIGEVRGRRTDMLRILAMVRQPAVPDTGSWHADIAALCERYYAQQLEPFAERMAAIDARMQRARGFEERLQVFRDIRTVVIEAHFGGKTLLPPVAAWHERHDRDCVAALDRMFAGQFVDRDAVFGPYHQLRQVIGRGRWSSQRSAGRFSSTRCLGVLDHAEKFAALRDADAFREFGRRLRWLRSSRTPPGTNAEYWAKVARGQLLARVQRDEAEGFAVDVLEHVRQQNLKGVFGYPKLADRVEALGASIACLDAPFVSIERDLTALQRCGFEHEQLAATFAAAMAERLRAGCDGQPEVDQAVARAVAEALGHGHAYVRTVTHARALLDQARKVPTTGSTDVRMAAYAQLATRTGEWGPACELVAGELSLPVGRELARKAAAVARVGDHGRAALLFVRAATLGNRTAPPMTSSWSVRRQYSALVAAEKKGELAGVDERLQWRILARMHAYMVAVLSLPVTARDEPIYDLQDRFLRAQLGGRARLSTVLGLRLAGLSDVRRKRKPEEDVRLVELDGKIVWRRSGEVVDLSRYRIDRDGWRRYRELQRELNQAEADLRAARKSSGTPRATLVQQQQALNGKIAELNERIQARSVEPAVANAEIERLKRESAALQSAIRNFNRRNDHIREMTRRFNAKVPPHNQLLERLLKEQATAYEQLLRPSNAEFAEARIRSCGRGDDEQQARRWLLGLVDAPELEAAVPVPHPDALAARVRDVSDPAVAAQDILASLRRRRDDQRLWRGVTMEQHLDALRGAVVAYGRQYGTDDLFERVMASPIVPADRYVQIRTFFDDQKRRDALQKRVDGK